MHTAICWSILFKHWSLRWPRTAVEGRAAVTCCPGTPSTVSRQPWRPTHGLMSTGAGQGFRGRPGVQGGRPGAQGPARGPGWPARGSGAGQGSRVAGQGFRGRPGVQGGRPGVQGGRPGVQGPARGPGWPARGSGAGQRSRVAGQGFRGRPLPHQRSRPICTNSQVECNQFMIFSAHSDNF